MANDVNPIDALNYAAARQSELAPRLQALSIAHNQADSPEEVVERAKAYVAFVEEGLGG